MSTRDVSPLLGLDDCGCCEGLGARTPEIPFNRPGLNEIAYRIGTHARFLDSMIARLTSAELPALGALKTRDSDDFTIALCDAWATVGDVITFYQERIANEAFLRTATERRSILELADLIGYQLRPGVSADAVLAFTLEQAPGAPQLAEATITIDAGLPVQSVPGPDELPQTFETTGRIEGRVAWNAMSIQTSELRNPAQGDIQMYLQGTSTLLKPGDPILIVGDGRDRDTTSLRWDVRVLTSVEENEEHSRTRVTWAGGLGAAPNQIVQTDVRIYALRQRAALFGFNAPDPRTLRLDTVTTSTITTGSGTTLAWAGYQMPATFIDLDSVYPKIVAGSWLVLTASGSTALAKANSVAERARTEFTISNRISRITPDVMPTVGEFELDGTAVYAQSEELTLAPTPLPLPLFGDVVALAERVEGLLPGQRLAVTGARLQLAIAGTAPALQLVLEDGGTVELEPDDKLNVLAAPVLVAIPNVIELVLSAADLQLWLTPFFALIKAFFFPALALRWTLQDRDGREGTVELQPAEFALIAAEEDADTVDEIVAIDANPDAVSDDRDRTSFKLVASLANVYDRNTVSVNANVTPATHGETVTEVLGSGDASQTYQRFVLRQTPLTYVTAATASGAASTLEVRVNDILWHEKSTLYAAASDERIYITRLDDDGFTTVGFGDGVNGARLPTGQENVRATYRKGIGLGGLVKERKLTQLMARPLGLKEVVNPHPAEGAEDPESRDQARKNAPLTVLTLDRTVSLRDYEDFARAFAGIAKAHAAWIWDGDGYGVLITVAGPGGAAISATSQVFADLLSALAAAGDPNARLRLESYRPALFRFAASLVIDADLQADLVIADVEAAMRSAYSFDARDFGQAVMLSEAIAAIQRVDGVIAVDVDSLYRGATAALKPRLIAELPEVTGAGQILAAELLTLDPAPLDKLEAMP